MKMLRFIVFVVFSAAAHGLQSPTKNQICKMANDGVDRVVEASNEEFRKSSIPVYTEGINQYVSLTIEGSSISPKIFFNTTRGELRSLPTLSRFGNAIMCTDEDHVTLNVAFQFGVLELHFNESYTKFLLGEANGKFTYKVKPVVNVFILKTSTDCHLDSYSIASTDSVDYNFQADSWTGKPVEAVLEGALRGGDTTPLLMSVQRASQQFIGSFFTKSWCKM